MIVWAIAVAVIILTTVSIVLFRRLASRLDAKECTAAWLEGFSTVNYLPMQRLLDKSDFEFLAAQPGYQPEIASELRAERAEILSGYLHLLTRDFNQLHAVAKMMFVYSDQDRPDFGKALLWQQITFYYAVIAVRCRLALMPLGWTVPDIRKLIVPIESMSLQLQRMAVHSSETA
jgi:hypothetical protein